MNARYSRGYVLIAEAEAAIAALRETMRRTEP